MTGFDGDTVAPLRAGLSWVCPRRGRGRLLAGFLDVAGRCDVCGLDLSVALLRPFKGVMIALQYRHRVQLDRDHHPT